MERVRKYFEEAFVYGDLFIVLGLALWVATMTLAIVLAANEDGARGDWYAAVAATTGIAGVTTALDFAGLKWITPCTVALGSFALLVSQSLWLENRADHLASALFMVQLLAVGIQIAAIANNSGRGPLGSNSGTSGKTPLLEL